MLPYRKSIFLSMLLVIPLTVAAGCGSSLDPTVRAQEGYIVDITEERIYVISHIDPEDIGELTEQELLDKSADNTEDRDLIAVWYSVDSAEEFEVGQYIEVRSREVLDSWPQQAEAAGIRILDSP